MCLAALAVAANARFPWVLLANRDEYFDRLSLPMAWWQTASVSPRLLSGRDCSAGGTWLGLNEAGRLALVTNVREPGRMLPVSPSRGYLVPHWLQAAGPALAMHLVTEVPRNGFNLLAADLAVDATADANAPAAWWLSNRPEARHHTVGPGVVGLSNAALDTPWPKVQVLKQRLHALLQRAACVADIEEAGFAALADRSLAPDTLLPDTGLPLARERQLSAAFIHVAGEAASQDYGTRCSTVVVVECMPSLRVVHVVERTFDRNAAISGEARFTLSLPAPGRR